MFRLADRLGKTVGELEVSLSSSELTEWAAYQELEPAGLFADDYRTLLGLCAQINANRKKDVDPVTPFDLFDLLPWRQGTGPRKRKSSAKAQQSPDEMRALLNRAARGNVKVARDG